MLVRARTLLVVAFALALLGVVSAQALSLPGSTIMRSAEDTGSIEPTDTVVEDVVRGTTTLVSADPNGIPARYYAQQPSVSDNGRYVAFISYSPELVNGDTNSVADVFVRDRVEGKTVNASVLTDGVQLNKISVQPHMSANGRYVVFTSEATNAFHNGSGFEAYRRDLLTGTTDKVSVTRTGGDPQNGSFASDISADGRLVTFDASADYEYVADDDNGYGDAFLRDMELGTTELVSLGDDEQQGNGWSGSASMSDDGRYVAFGSYATNLVNDDHDGVFLRDRVLGTTARVSTDVSGVPLLYAGGPVVSADGSVVVFTAVYHGNWHVFVHDVATAKTECVSVAPDGSLGNGQCNEPTLSSDGKRIVFVSMATNLVLGDINGKTDVFIRDLVAGVTRRVSVTNNREEAILGGGGDACGTPSCDATGGAIAFGAIGLSYGDARSHELVYVRDLETTATVEQSAKHLVTTSTVTLGSYGAAAGITGQMCTGEGAFASEHLSVANVSGGQPVTVTTSHSGRFAVNVRPLSKTTYRIAPTNGAAWAEGATRLVTVVPRAYVSAPAAPSRMRRTRYYSVTGTIRPRHKAGTSPVRIYRWKKTSTGRWKPYGYVTAKTSDITGGSKYLRKVRLPYRGKWRLRAYAPIDSGHASAWSSGYDYVTVK